MEKLVVIDHVKRRGIGWVALLPSGGALGERIDLAIEAVNQVKDLELLITGRSKTPACLGFLPRAIYLRLVGACDFVLNINEEPFTIPHFFYEAIAYGTPIVTTPDKAIETVFGNNIYYLSGLSMEDIVNGLRAFLVDLEDWTQRARQLYVQLSRVREQQITDLKKIVNAV